MNLTNSSKTVILNDDHQTFSIVNMLSKTKQNREPLNYIKLNHANKNLNIYECSEV